MWSPVLVAQHLLQSATKTINCGLWSGSLSILTNSARRSLPELPNSLDGWITGTSVKSQAPAHAIRRLLRLMVHPRPHQSLALCPCPAQLQPQSLKFSQPPHLPEDTTLPALRLDIVVQRLQLQVQPPQLVTSRPPIPLDQVARRLL